MLKEVNGQYIEMTQEEINKMKEPVISKEEKEQELKDLLTRVQELAKELDL